MTHADSTDQTDLEPLRPLLDEEIGRLPAKYRTAVVLCYLEGHSNDEAARQMRCSISAIKMRLLRARDLLKSRLERRVLGLAVAGLGALLEQAASAAPETLVATTIKAADCFVAGSAAGASVPAALAEGVLRAMWYTKVKLTAAVTLTLATVGIVLGLSLGGTKSTRPVAVATPPVNTADRTAVVKGGNAFTFDLYAKIRDDRDHKGKNVFFSPVSISTALAMTYGGARGTTAEEMARTLHFTLGQEQLHPAVGALVRDLNGTGKPRNYKLSVANALWGQSGHPFRAEFLALNQANYDAGLNLVDYIGAAEQARLTINDWCQSKTENKIKDLLPNGSVDSLTRLVLTNAIYFKGNWDTQFDKKLTEAGDFQVTVGSTVKVPLMHRLGSYRYLAADGVEALELPCKDKELSMFVFLPETADGLPELEKSFKGAQPEAWIARLTPLKEQAVDVTLPRFTITDPIHLNPALTSLGMAKAFAQGQADFSGIASGERLFIKSVFHKAFVDVNEEGTEAAAATAVAIPGGGDLADFRADHPFLFLIRDNASGSILFMGRVVDPSAK